jgi:hypothetical protein
VRKHETLLAIPFRFNYGCELWDKCKLGAIAHGPIFGSHVVPSVPLVTPDFTYDTERGSKMRKRTLATWTAALGLVAATGAQSAQAANCPTSGNITTDCDTTGLSIVVDDQSSGGAPIIDCSTGFCTVSPTQLAQKFYSLHDRAAYDFLIVCPNFATSDGARNIPVDTGDGVIRSGTELEVTGLGPGLPSLHGGTSLRSSYGATGHLQSVIQLPNCLNFPVDNNTRFPAADPNAYHSALSLLAEQMGHRWAAYPNIPGGNATALIANGKNWQFYTNSASTCPSAAPAGTLCASSLWGNNWPASGTLTTSSRTDGFSQLDQYFMGLRDAAAVDPFFYIASPNGGPASNAAPHRAGNAAVTLTGGTRTNVTIADIQAQNGARTPNAASSPKTFTQGFVVLTQNGNPVTQATVTKVEQLRQDWVKYFSETTDHTGEVDTRVKKRPVDVLFLLDLSGSFSDDLPVLKANFQSLLNDLVATTSPGSQFGVASFVDFPFSPYGTPPADYTYKVDLPLTTNTVNVTNTINGLTTYDGSDLPQNQYEAIYQAITGEGVDLNGDGVFTGLGEVAPSSIGHFDPGVPLFILLFTDATFHNPDTESAYPTSAGNSHVHGRNAVLSHLIPPSPFAASAAFVPTPKTYVFGMVPGLGLPPDMGGILEIPELNELATLTGGNLFPLSHDSAGVVAAVKQAVDDTSVPVLEAPKVLQKVGVRAATVHWNHDQDCDHGQDRNSLVLEQGTVDLPDATGFTQVGLHSKVSLGAANLSLVTDEVNFVSANTKIGTLWHFRDTTKTSGITEYDILWTSPTHGEYLIMAEFDSATRNLNGNIRPASLTTLISLGTGTDALSGDATVQGSQWKTLTSRHWQSKILIPLTTVAASQVAEEGKMLSIGFDPEADGSENAEAAGCALVARRGEGSGKMAAAWTALALLGASVVVRRRKRS